jgi:hypothetical protein
MKRNMELVRQILLQVEKNTDPAVLIDPKVEGHTETEISYHIMLAADAGLVEAQDRTAIGVFRWSASFLTWSGHEFVDAARDDAVWEEAKGIADASGQGVSFDVLKKILLENAEKRIRSDVKAKAS